MRRVPSLAMLLCLTLLAGCGGGSPGSPAQSANPPTSSVNVTIAGSTVPLRLFETRQFSATVTGSNNTAVSWSVNDVPGGNATVGTISSAGLYTTPAAMPAAAIAVKATSAADPSKTATAAVSLLNPIPTVSAVVPGSVDPGAFTIAVAGTAFVSGAKVTFGGVDLPTTFISATALRATGTAAQAAGTAVSLTVTNPKTANDTASALVSNTASVPVNLINSRVAARFLDQATFGASSADIAHVAQIGLNAWLQEQFAMTPSTLSDPASTSLQPVQYQWLHNALAGKDQLRQRMAFALQQIWVISGVDIANATEYVPFLRTVQQDAFGNYLTLMKDVTLSPAMGDYLDMVNNDKPDPVRGTHANENYARELLQLFTIGLTKLNPDGTPVLDASGMPAPTYSQNDVQEFSRALTGWTWPTRPGAVTPTSGHNPAYYIGSMVAIEANHDTAGKTLLRGTLLPAGQTAAQDLDGALQNIFQDPSMPPFVCKNLIQHFVSSNPSGAYLQRCSTAFANNGAGVRGDLKAVITAILLDPEARADDYPNPPGAGGGHLREPILLVTSLLRSLNATTDGTTAETQLTNQATNMGQRILYSPTVFNYYPPDWVIISASATNPAAVLGPEFALLTTATATVRANFVNAMMGGFNNTAQVTVFGAARIDYSPYAAFAADSNALLDVLDGLLLHGQMSSPMRASIKTAVDAIPAANAVQRAKTAIYLIGSSSQYQVVH